MNFQSNYSKMDINNPVRTYQPFKLDGQEIEVKSRTI